MFLGLRTAIYYVDDMAKARDWYAGVLGLQPYFDEPFYIGFNVGGYELGLHPQEENQRGKNEGVVAYWGVANAEMEYDRLLTLGAVDHQKVTDVGGGIKVGTVFDPCGNIFGVIENPHFSISGS